MARLDYERLACRVLRLRHPDEPARDGAVHHALGYVRMADAPTLVDAAVKRRQALVRGTLREQHEKARAAYQARVDGSTAAERAAAHAKFHATEDALHQQAGKTVFFSFREYLDACSKVGRQRGHVPGPLSEEAPLSAAFYGLVRRYARDRFTPDRAGYLRYLHAVAPDFAALLRNDIPALLPEADRQLATYLVATRGSGKTELLKLLIHAYVRKPRLAAVVAIDPAGDFAGQIARWREFAEGDRLIYVDPYLAEGHAPTINPLEISGVAAADTSERALARKQVVAQQLLEAFEEILAGELGGVLSLNMKTLLLPCLLVLLSRPGATLRDLRRFLRTEHNADLVEQGRRYPEADIAEFFAGAFGDPTYEPTKKAIATKLQRLFNTGTFGRLTCGKSTIDLERALNERKVIVFNLAKGKLGADASQAYGRLLLATLQGIALRREDVPETWRVPCHVFVDECHNYITESVRLILLEARKFKVFLTLCQQVVGEGMSPAMRDVVTGARVVIAGVTEPVHRRATTALFPVEPEELAALRTGAFLVRTGESPPFRLRAATDLLGWSNSMSTEAWEATRREQLRRYYRRLAESEPGATPSAGVAGEGAEEPLGSLKRRLV